MHKRTLQLAVEQANAQREELERKRRADEARQREETERFRRETGNMADDITFE